jgi:DNA-3-methyladenine glycosylase
MRQRAQKSRLDPGSGSGPGKVSKLLGIHYSHSGIDLLGDTIWLEDRGRDPGCEILTGTRIGVEYAGQDALLPYRFYVKEV